MAFLYLVESGRIGCDSFHYFISESREEAVAYAEKLMRLEELEHREYNDKVRYVMAHPEAAFRLTDDGYGCDEQDLRPEFVPYVKHGYEEQEGIDFWTKDGKGEAGVEYFTIRIFKDGYPMY